MSLLRFKFGMLMLLAITSAGPGQPVESNPATDFHGDPLPPGAIARMGTTRLRHGKTILDYALSSDGKRMISFGAEGSLVEWSAEEGKELRRWNLPHGPFTAAALSHDRKLLATIGDENPEFVLPQLSAKTNRTIRLWEVVSGKEIQQISEDSRTTGGLAFSSDGKTLATVSQGHLIHLWEIPGGRLLHRLDAKELLRYQAPLAFSSDGGTLVSGGENGKIHVWDVPNGKKLREIQVPEPRKVGPGITKRVGMLAFSPIGDSFASRGFDNDVLVWNASNGKQNRRFENAGYMYDASGFTFGNLAFSTDGKSLVFPDKDGVIGKWDIATGAERQRYAHGYRPLLAANDSVLAMVRGNSIVFWDVVQRKERPGPVAHPHFVLNVSLSPDGKTLATTGIDGFCLWDVATGKPRTIPANRMHMHVAFSPDGKTIASGGQDSTVLFSDAATGKEIKKITIHQKPRPVRALAFRPNGTMLSIGLGGEICLTDPATGTVTPFSEEQTMVAMAVSPNGERMLCHIRREPISFWDLTTRKRIGQLPSSVPFHRHLAFSADGAWFAAADGTDGLLQRTTADHSLYLHVAATGKQVRQFGKGLHTYRAIAFSPDGRTLATGGDDNFIRLFEVASGLERQRFSGHTNYVSALAFHPGGSLISGSHDGTALVWDVLALPPPRDLKPADLDASWADLAKDAEKAFDALRKLAAAPKQAVPFLAKHMQPAQAIPPNRLVALLKALGSDKLDERNQAALELENLGDGAEIALRKAVADNLPLEHTRRIRQLIDKLPAPITTEQLRGLRAVETLERIGTVDARQILTTLAKGPPSARVTQDAKAAMDRLAKGTKKS